jgi:hypothetical protein
MSANLEVMEDNFEIIDQTGYHQNVSANYFVIQLQKFDIYSCFKVTDFDLPNMKIFH